ncbi:MAG: class I SAM-dependent methyltransferase [Gammaproteobacteria bacterium]|nr:class I SAM-dependent methyltransferase [Gammaproteobacteria bacterium]
MRSILAMIVSGWLLASPALATGTLDLAAPGRPAADLKRDAVDHPQDVLAFAGVQPGMVIADIFGGAGYYAELAAQIVGPQGRIYLHNNAAYLGFVGEPLDMRLKDERLPNVVRLDREADALGLSADSLDGVFLVLAYHDFFFSDKDWSVTARQVMPQLRAALKPGAFLLVVDHRAKPGVGTQSAQELHRVEESSARASIESFGFEFVKSSELLRNPEDDGTRSAFYPELRGRTDRFMHMYRSPD